MVSVLEFQFYDYLMTLVSLSYHDKMKVFYQEIKISVYEM